MSKKEKPSEKFTISLRENGLHSLWRGIEAYGAFDRTQDKLTLKDAIMFLHHGVELLMKEILVKHSPFLISEGMLREVDILGEGQGFRWVIEIKGVLRDGQSGIAQVRSLSHALKAQPWLIVFTDLSASTRAAAHAHGVLITGANEWKELKKLILAESHNA